MSRDALLERIRFMVDQLPDHALIELSEHVERFHDECMNDAVALLRFKHFRHEMAGGSK